MTFDEYKVKLKENLVLVSNEIRAQEVLDTYEDELEDFYNDGWTVEGLTPALLMGI